MFRKDPPMVILDLLEKGQITVNEAEARLRAPFVQRDEADTRLHALTVQDDESIDVSLGHRNGKTSMNDPSNLKQYQWFWLLPVIVGSLIVGLSILWMQNSISLSGTGFWFYFAWIPLFLGTLILILGLQSRTARWIHLRVFQKEGEWPQKIAISFPLPLRWITWFINLFGDKIPQLDKTSVDEILLALEHETESTPILIEVDEGKNGERVQVYIG